MNAGEFNLFFAIFPDQDAAARLERLAAKLRADYGLSGKPFTADRFHVSLHSLGVYDRKPDEIVGAAKLAAAQTTSAPYGVTFDRLESFTRTNRDTHPLVLTGDDGLAALKDFRNGFGASLKKAGLRRRPAAAFAPHVTLLYDERCIPESHPVVPPISWEVKAFTLVWSHIGKSRYDLLGEWPLRGAEE